MWGYAPGAPGSRKASTRRQGKGTGVHAEAGEERIAVEVVRCVDVEEAMGHGARAGREAGDGVG